MSKIVLHLRNQNIEKVLSMKIKITVVGLAVALLFGCAKKNEFKEPPPPEVTVQHPLQKDVVVFQGFPGRLVASESVDIRARVKGFLKSIDFVDGQRVKKGALLFTIEPEEYEAAVQSAEAKLAQAKASLKLADATLKRTKKAYETKAVSELDVLSAEAKKQGADATVKEEKAALKNAKLDLSYTKIRAPMSGRVARRSMSVGNLVGDGSSTLLTTLVVEAPLDVFFNVDERSMIPFLQKGVRKVETEKVIPPLKLELADKTMHDEDGILNYVDPEIDPDTGTLRARAVFKNKELKLMPGMYGKILVPRKVSNAVLIPEISIQRDMAGFYVLVVNKDGKVERREVVRGDQLKTQRIIKKGLSPKDNIIVEGIQRARPGISVKATESKPKSSK